MVGPIEGQSAHFLSAYDDLRRLARAYMRTGDRQTLQPTALVHEAWLKLVDADPARWESREHFIHAAARAMRQILVDRARRNLALKRQPPAVLHEPLDREIDLVQLIQLEDAMVKLEAMDPELARIVELRYYVGCTSQEAGDLLGLPERTVRHRWGIAKGFLTEQMQLGPRGEP